MGTLDWRRPCTTWQLTCRMQVRPPTIYNLCSLFFPSDPQAFTDIIPEFPPEQRTLEDCNDCAAHAIQICCFKRDNLPRKRKCCKKCWHVNYNQDYFRVQCEYNKVPTHALPMIHSLLSRNECPAPKSSCLVCSSISAPSMKISGIHSAYPSLHPKSAGKMVPLLISDSILLA